MRKEWGPKTSHDKVARVTIGESRYLMMTKDNIYSMYSFHGDKAHMMMSTFVSEVVLRI